MGRTIDADVALEHIKKRLYETALNNSPDPVGPTFAVTPDVIYQDIAENRIETWLSEVPSHSRLRERRKAAGITQKELSERSGVNKRMIEQYEQGVKSLSDAAARTVYQLARALGCEVEDLLEI